MRIGQGFDVHAFGPGDYVTLGGVRIPHSRGLKAHSDGDVLIHAACDALLGAAAAGDIGAHFPPTDPRWADADSRDLLRRVAELVGKAAMRVVNIDVTVICEQPKIAPHADLMRSHLAADLALARECVSIKATTTEGLGFCGRGDGIAAIAVALLLPAPHDGGAE